ncbi:MAG: 50S ribosomal protein L4 [Phycisphaerae bacterium]
MIEVPILNIQGQEVGKYQLDESLLGGTVSPALLKQAVVYYHANLRQGTVRQRSRGEIEGSTKKLFNQKKTGNARRGSIRTSVMKGGGLAFPRRPRDFRQDMPAQQRRQARNNALLSKVLSSGLKLLDGFSVTKPQTKTVVSMLKALNADRSVLIATDKLDNNLYLSARNIARTAIKPAAEINAYDLLTKRTVVMTKAALENLIKPAKA